MDRYVRNGWVYEIVEERDGGWVLGPEEFSFPAAALEVWKGEDE
jgi:hypothetical protein